MTNELSIQDFASAKLPAVYERAKTALAECERIDECKNWANKAEALASYARQSHDNEMRLMADRIQARAIRRCGELLKEVPAAPGRRTDLKPSGDAPTGLTAPPGRFQAAADAGLSRDQAVTALRVANVPADQFEEAVESDQPPTVTQLAKLGTNHRNVEFSGEVVDIWKGNQPAAFQPVAPISEPTIDNNELKKIIEVLQEIEANASNSFRLAIRSFNILKPYDDITVRDERINVIIDVAMATQNQWIAVFNRLREFRK